MSEEAAEVSEVEEVSTPEVEESGFDMDSAVSELGADLFGKEESEEAEIEEEAEVEKKVEVKVEKEQEEEKKEEKPKREAPNSWKKEYRELYSSADPALQEIIDLREAQMHEGLEKDRGDASLGRTMRDMMAPYEGELKTKGISTTQAMQSLIQSHNILTTGTPQQKLDLMNQMARNYGVGKPPENEDPQVASLTQRLREIEQNIDTGQQQVRQATEARIESEVSAFAEDHPFFDDLSDEIATFIRAGDDLEDAYNKAVWSNPATRQKELDRQNKETADELEKKARQEAEDARIAKSVNVKGMHTKKTPTAPKGKFLDDSDMRETLREIQSRN